MYQGFADPQVTSDNAIRYHQMVLEKVGKQAEGKSIELFMVPGMYHCQGGPGTDTFDKTAATRAWVDNRKAPDRIVASHVDRRQGRSHAAAVRVPEGGEVERHRQHGRRGELLVRRGFCE